MEPKTFQVRIRARVRTNRGILFQAGEVAEAFEATRVDKGVCVTEVVCYPADKRHTGFVLREGLDFVRVGEAMPPLLQWRGWQSMRGEETPAFCGTLLADGQPVCDVRSDGRGGSAIARWLTHDEALRAAVTEESFLLAKSLLGGESPSTLEYMRSVSEAVLVWASEIGKERKNARKRATAAVA